MFADIEASGLGLGTYPVEFGWASVRHDRVQVADVLVRPSDEWLARDDAWTAEAEALHGLSRERLLSEGTDISGVCRILNEAWGGKEICFDTGCDSHDSRWLGQLYRATDLSPSFSLCTLSSSEVILSMARRRMVPDRILRELIQLAPRPKHRAAADAAIWSWWQAAIDRLTENGAARCLDLSGEALVGLVEIEVVTLAVSGIRQTA